MILSCLHAIHLSVPGAKACCETSQDSKIGNDGHVYTESTHTSGTKASSILFGKCSDVCLRPDATRYIKGNG